MKVKIKNKTFINYYLIFLSGPWTMAPQSSYMQVIREKEGGKSTLDCWLVKQVK